MSRAWDIHDFNDPDDDPVTRLRHLAGDYGPNDPAYWEFDSSDDSGDGWDSDDSFVAKLYEDFENEQKKYPLNSRDELDRTPAGPMVSLYDTRYFVPQWDEQMLGPEWRQKRGKWDFENPPKPLPLTDPKMKDAFKYCEQCQLTWLVGYDKLDAHQHPQHLACEKKAEYIDHYLRLSIETEASVVIYTRGDCLPKGQTSKSIVGNIAGFGIFFGKDSKYNVASAYRNKFVDCDAEDAELAAINSALARVRYSIVKDRKELLRAFAKSKREDISETGANLAKLDIKNAPTDQESNTNAAFNPTEASEDNKDALKKTSKGGGDETSNDVLNKLPFRVIFVSDNATVVDNICKYQKQWKEEDGKLLTKQGKPVKNGDMYQRLEDTMSDMEDDLDTTFKWYCVPKELNMRAAELANEALEGNFIGFDG